MTAPVAQSMRAWQVHRLGAPADALRLLDAALPRPASGQVLVRVRAAALNFPDLLMAAGTYQVRPPLPFVPGVEAVGDVVEVAADGDATLVGRRVVGTTVVPDGALAGFALLDAACLAPAPDDLDDAEAAGYCIAYQTGWVGLHRRARLQPGETLLVHAAAGGVGSAAVQLGRAAGARVIAVVGGAEKVSVATDLGADVVLDRTVDDLVPAIREATGGRGVDVVYDPVGGDAFSVSTKTVAFEGRILVVGFASGRVPQAATNHALVKNYGVLGLHWGLYVRRAPHVVEEAYRALATLVEAGAVRPLVSRRLGFEAAVTGLEALAGGRTTGRVVVAGPGA